ncbi:hypothetical protein OG900_10115 [Streptomyces sp. NBC_00433]
MTRSTAKDYAFVGAIPPEQWWDRYSDTGLLFTTEPAVALRGTAGGWSAVLFGVPSARTDRDDRRIRYTLIAESGAEDAALAARLVRVALDPDAREKLGRRLDKIYSGELLNSYFSDRAETGAPDLAEAVGALREAAGRQPADIPPYGPVEPPLAGPYDLPAARDAFIAHAHALAGGGTGLCLVAAGAASLKDVRPALDLAGRRTALLLPNASLTKVVALKKDTPPPPRRKPNWQWVAAVLGGSLVLLILWLMRKL